jgi:hypothetical protein
MKKPATKIKGIYNKENGSYIPHRTKEPTDAKKQTKVSPTVNTLIFIASKSLEIRLNI